MLSVISSIISSVLGLVLDKARNTAADKLRERGDVADKRLRDLIVKDLHDIKTKIEGLARKDLLASYSFLNEGIVTLYLALDEAKEKEMSKDEANPDEDGRSKTSETATRNESESGVLNEVIKLSTAIQKLNNTSDSFASTKHFFRAAREKATEAFWNEALSLPDRIMATKLRVASKILECLENTKAAAVGCMLFLEEFHNLPAIGENLSTYFKGGIKARLYKVSRLENVKSVLSLNFAISEFIARFSGGSPDVRNWPRIHLPTRGERIHPLVIDMDVVKEIFNTEEFQMPENQVISDEIFSHSDCCINSKEELLISNSWCVQTVSRSGDEKRFSRHEYFEDQVEALAIDRHDNVFVITSLEVERDTTSPLSLLLSLLTCCLTDCTNTHTCCAYVLHVYDSCNNFQHTCELDFLESITHKTLNCVVNNDIFIHKDRENEVYICDSNGNSKSCLTLEENSSYHSGDFIYMECVTDDDDIVMRTRENVLVYTKQGELKRTIKVKNDIEAVTYNYFTSKIQILIRKKSICKKSISHYIISYSVSKIDEVEKLYLPVKSSLRRRIKFCQHPSGCAAIMIKNNGEHSIIFM